MLCKQLNGQSGYLSLKNAIEACSKEPREYNNSIVVVQSSGSGKTFAAVELSRHKKIIYLQCLDKGDDGVRLCDPRLASAIALVTQFGLQPAEREKIVVKFLYALLTAATEFRTIKELNDAQFDSDKFFASRKS